MSQSRTDVPVWRVQALRAPLRRAFVREDEPDPRLPADLLRLLDLLDGGVGRT